MIDQPEIKLPAEALREMRDLLAANLRETGHRGIDEVVDLAGRADELVADLMRHETK